MALQPGQILNNRYRIEEMLGQGGMATVYLGYDTLLERQVAVKLIRKEAFGLDVLEGVLKRFEREVKTLARLSHTNIINIHDYGDYQSSPYLVMEYLPGGTLKDQMGSMMTPQEAARLLLPVAQALEHSHGKGIVHRDIKPSNILFDENGAPKLADFGIVRIIGVDGATALTMTGVGIGTPEYMSPEQGMGKTIDHKTDVYSLGVLLYEMVTGQKPFEADTPIGVIVKHINDPLPLPSKVVPGLPERIEAVIVKAMAKAPRDRYPDMKAIIQELGEIIRGFKDIPVLQANQTDAIRDEKATVKVDTLRLDEQGEKVSPFWKRLPTWTWFIVLFVVVLGGLMTVFWPDQPGPTEITQTTFSSVTETDPATSLTSLPLATEVPLLEVGSTQVSPKDGMVLAFIPSGEFEMGSAEFDEGKPVHTVHLDAYWMDQHPVTNAMYATFLNDQGNQREDGAPWLDTHGEDVLITQSDGTWMPLSGYEEHPVIHITWYGAQAYCTWVERRLPTEAEWEKAARGGLVGKTYPWGDDDPVCSAGTENGAQYSLCGGKTVPVKTFAPNGYGLYDMAGNVWEWVMDWYDPDYYSESPPSNPAGPPTGTYRGLRGGSWAFDIMDLNSAFRNWDPPEVARQNIGFRCALSP
jgi:formylglycine-generating enzyme required for sulfatase activity/tRNA A-37 threonylcarbamoyl transferase component Bud32